MRTMLSNFELVLLRLLPFLPPSRELLHFYGNGAPTKMSKPRRDRGMTLRDLTSVAILLDTKPKLCQWGRERGREGGGRVFQLSGPTPSKAHHTAAFVKALSPHRKVTEGRLRLRPGVREERAGRKSSKFPSQSKWMKVSSWVAEVQ